MEEFNYKDDAYIDDVVFTKRELIQHKENRLEFDLADGICPSCRKLYEICPCIAETLEFKICAKCDELIENCGCKYTSKPFYADEY